MSGINKVILIGNVGNDPEFRTMGSGKVCNFTLATSETWKDKTTGERKEQTEWHRICVFNSNIVDVIEKFVRKGTKLFIQGALKTRKWENKQGQEVYTTEIVLNNFSSQLLILDGAKDIGSNNE